MPDHLILEFMVYSAEMRDHIRVLQNSFGVGGLRHSDIGIECQLLTILERARREEESLQQILGEMALEGLS